MTIPLRAVAIAVSIHILWGGNPVAVKLGLELFPPLWSAFVRFLVGLVIITVWAKTHGVRLRPYPREWGLLARMGVLFAVQIALMNTGFSKTTGAMGAVLITTYPLFAAGLAHVFIAGDRLAVAKGIGLAFAFAGASLVLTQRASGEQLQLANAGNWIVLLSAAMLGGRTVFAARLLENMEPARLLVWQMLLALPLFAAGGLAWETVAWSHLGWKPIAGLAYQGIVIAGFGFMISHYLLKTYTPSVIVSFGFVAPVSGVLLSAWILSDPVGLQFGFGLATMAVGLYLIARG